MEQERVPGPLSYVGGGCGCLGCLTLLSGLVMVIGIPAGLYNYSIEAQMGISGGASSCVGGVMMMIGIALWQFGKKDPE